MLKLIRSFIKQRQGHILLQVIIAFVTVGSVTYVIVNNDILPGLKDKWDIQSQTIQNNWIN